MWGPMWVRGPVSPFSNPINGLGGGGIRASVQFGLDLLDGDPAVCSTHDTSHTETHGLMQPLQRQLQPGAECRVNRRPVGDLVLVVDVDHHASIIASHTCSWWKIRTTMGRCPPQ